MGLLDKMKNLFTEEVEEEIDEPITKEVIQVEIPSPEEKKEHIPIIEEKEEIISAPEPKIVKEESNFPFFDDEDFDVLDKKAKKREERKKNSYRQESYKEPKEVYMPVKEEKRTFKPSPIISPVYGILDKNYQKEEIRTKAPSFYAKEASVDEIRNRAYGTLEDDIETTLFGKNNSFFEEDEKLEATISAEDDFIPEETDVADLLEERPRHGTNQESDLTDLLEAEMLEEEPTEVVKPKKTQKEIKEPRKISDKELFSMIDSMYQKGDKE